VFARWTGSEDVDEIEGGGSGDGVEGPDRRPEDRGVDVCRPAPLLLLLFKNAAGLIERRRKTCVRQKSVVLAIIRAVPLTEDIFQSEDAEALRVSEEFDLCCYFPIATIVVLFLI
jgi:hypothetical protein